MTMSTSINPTTTPLVAHPAGPSAPTAVTNLSTSALLGWDEDESGAVVAPHKFATKISFQKLNEDGEALCWCSTQ